MANTTGKKVQIPVLGGLRKVVRVGGGGDSTATTIAGFEGQSVTLGQLRAQLGLPAGNSAPVTPGGGGGGGATAQIVLGPGLAGGGAVVGAVPIRLIQPIPAFIFDDGGGDDAPPPVPGQRGANGANGTTGGPGPMSPGIFLSDVPDEIEPIPIPGSRGPTGGPGVNGVQGQNGVAVYFADPPEDPDVFMIPGSRGATGAAGSTGANGAPGQSIWLPEDSNDNELIVPAYTPSAAPPGAYTLISRQVLSGLAGSVTFSSIPQNFENLVLVISAATNNGSGPVSNGLQFNGDTAANYFWAQGFTLLGNTVGASSQINQTSISCGYGSGTSAPANSFSTTKVTLIGYARTTTLKSLNGTAWRRDDSSGNQFTLMIGGDWNSAAAITSLTLTPGGGSYIPGCVFSLYGES